MSLVRDPDLLRPVEAIYSLPAKKDRIQILSPVIKYTFPSAKHIVVVLACRKQTPIPASVET